MQNIFTQIGKTLFLYTVGWTLLYPIYIIVGFITYNNIFWFPMVCLLVACEGALIWWIKNRRNVSTKNKSLKNIQPTHIKNLGIQFIVALILFIIVLMKERYQIYYSLIPYRDFLENLLGNRDVASVLSFGNVPIINGGNFLIVSIGWGFYNITQLLFDKRIRR